jgi:hypothetical protein
MPNFRTLGQAPKRTLTRGWGSPKSPPHPTESNFLGDLRPHVKFHNPRTRMWCVTRKKTETKKNNTKQA